jgi:hypothetical protein
MGKRADAEDPSVPGIAGQGRFERVRSWLLRPDPVPGAVPPAVRRLGVLWVCVSVPFTTVVSAFARTEDTFVFVLIFMGFGAYTLPSLFASRYVVNQAPAADRLTARSAKRSRRRPPDQA